MVDNFIEYSIEDLEERIRISREESARNMLDIAHTIANMEALVNPPNTPVQGLNESDQVVSSARIFTPLAIGSNTVPEFIPGPIGLQLRAAPIIVPPIQCEVVYSDRITNATEEVVKELECSICLGIFRIPRHINGCKHLFCHHCIAEIGSRDPDQIYHCPECRAVGVELETNQIVDNIIARFMVILNI